MPLDGEAKPISKRSQLARGERRYHRKVASSKRWQVIAAAKQGDCRVCRKPGPNQLHHLVDRVHGGSDTEANIVPLCSFCHGRIGSYERDAVQKLVASLDDAEYSYAIHHGGERFFERRYGLRYERA